ncbi:glycosyl hydrolase catalytic core-domain-containing protein [Mycena leptocephala]|nr:glycosyl hydrolase catalytic core-domain-containing protein [Mycena leptocephala]
MPDTRKKAGLGWNNNKPQDMSQFLSPQVPCFATVCIFGGPSLSFQNRYYDWRPEPSDDATGLSVEFVPMLWGKNQTETFSETINDTIRALNVITVLGMNECTARAWSINLTAAEGAHMWQQYLEPLRSRNIRPGSPAPSGAPGSTEWLTNFLNECGQGCTVDFLPQDSYGTNATAFKEFLVNYHEVFKLLYHFDRRFKIDGIIDVRNARELLF